MADQDHQGEDHQHLDNLDPSIPIDLPEEALAKVNASFGEVPAHH